MRKEWVRVTPNNAVHGEIVYFAAPGDTPQALPFNARILRLCGERDDLKQQLAVAKAESARLNDVVNDQCKTIDYWRVQYGKLCAIVGERDKLQSAQR